MLEVILDSIVRVGNTVGNKVGNALSENQINIIKEIKKNNKISAKRLSEIVGIPKRKVEENIAKLKKMNILIRINGTRRYWEIKN